MEIPDISEAEKLDRFIRGLKGRTRQEVELSNPQNLDEAERIADRVDQILFARSSVSRRSFYREQNSETPNKPTPMEVDNIQQTFRQSRPPRNINNPQFSSQRVMNLADRRCFKCHEKGHLAYDCPQRQGNNKMQQGN